MKKLGIILASVLLILTGAFLGARWYFFSRVPGHAQLIPAEAKAVIAIKPQRLMYDMFRYGVRLDDSILFPGFFSRLHRDSNSRRILSQLPVNYSSSIYLFYATNHNKGYWGVILSLDKTPEKLELKAQHTQDISLVYRPHFTLGWKNKEAIVLLQEKADSNMLANLAARLLNTRGNLVDTHPFLKSSLQADGLVTAWLRTEGFENGRAFSGMSLQAANSEAYMVLKSLKDEVQADIYTAKPVSTPQKTPGTPGILNYLQNQPVALLSSSLRDTAAHITGSWLGFDYSRVQVALADTVNITKEFIDYEYDDDFNQVPVIRKVQQVNPGFVALADVNDMAAVETRLKEKAQALDNTGLNYLVDGTFRVQLNRDTRQVLFTNHQRQFGYTEKHAWAALENEIDKHSLYMRIQPERLSMYSSFLTQNLDPNAQNTLAILEAYIRYLEITGNPQADHFTVNLAMKGNQGYGIISLLRMLYVLSDDGDKAVNLYP